MALEISVERIEEPLFDLNYGYHAYVVRADQHRIFTVVTEFDRIASKWLNDVVKFTKNKPQAPLFVGVSVEREALDYTKGGLQDTPYDILNLCFGSDCLIYHLSGTTYKEPCLAPRSLRSFFDNPRVVAVGMNMKTVAQNLDRDFGIKIKNPMELRSMAVKGLKSLGDRLDLLRYDLDLLAKAVLGKHMEVIRPEEKLQWYDGYYYFSCRLSLQKVQFATIDAYLCFLVGSELHDMINGASTGTSFSTNGKKKKVVKKKKQQKTCVPSGDKNKMHMEKKGEEDWRKMKRKEAEDWMKNGRREK